MLHKYGFRCILLIKILFNYIQDLIMDWIVFLVLKVNCKSEISLNFHDNKEFFNKLYILNIFRFIFNTYDFNHFYFKNDGLTMKCSITYFTYFAIDTVPNEINYSVCVSFPLSFTCFRVKEHLFSLIESVIMFLLALLNFSGITLRFTSIRCVCVRGI